MASEIITSLVSICAKWGLPNLERPVRRLLRMIPSVKKQGMWLMKIQYGNGVLVVVRARESLVQGEGEQSFQLILNWEGA